MDKEVEIIPIYYDYAMTTDYPVYVMVGGRLSGKTFFMEQYSVAQMNNAENYKMLVVEDVEKNIGEGVKTGTEARIEDIGHSSIYKPIKKPPRITNLINGNSMIFHGYRSDDQQKQVKSLNDVTAAWFEEAENITYSQFKALRLQLRGGDAKDRKLFLTLNPINPDSFINATFFQSIPDQIFERFPDGRPKVFVKNLIVEYNVKELPEDFYEEHTPDQYEIVNDVVLMKIPCMVIVTIHKDNKFLTMAQRADVEEYKYTDPDKYAMLAEGKFVRPSNVHFPEFERGIHVIDPFPIPEEWIRYTATDYGLDMEATLWIAVDFEGNGYVYKESYKPNLIVSEAVKEIRQVNNHDRIYRRYGPTDLYARGKDTGITTWELFSKHGWPLMETDNKRDRGSLAMKEWLKVVETMQPDGSIIKTTRLKFFKNCTNIIRTLPQVVTDKSNPNRYATLSNELETKIENYHELTHAPDALRYFCSMHECIPLKPATKTIEQQFFGEKKKKSSGYDQTVITGEGF